MLGMGPEEDKLENGGHGGFLESFKVNLSPSPAGKLTCTEGWKVSLWKVQKGFWA